MARWRILGRAAPKVRSMEFSTAFVLGGLAMLLMLIGGTVCTVHADNAVKADADDDTGPGEEFSV